MIKGLRANKNSRSGLALINTGLQRFYPLLLLLAIALLCWLLASVIWLIVSPPLAPQLSPIALPPPKTTNNANANALDIFPKPTTTATVQPPPAIKIVGVTVAEPVQNSYAILTINGKTQNYRVNNLLEGNQYKLSKVARDFITVTDLSGKTTKIDFGQKFSLDQSEAIRSKTLSATANTAIPTTGTPNPSIQNPALPNSTMNRSGLPQLTNPPNSPTPSTAQSALSEAASALQQNPAAYLTNMGVLAAGQGYQVTDGMPAGLRNRLGLQSGDKIVSVNGQSVGQNASQDAQLLQQIQQSGQAQIQVQRGSQTITVRQSF